MPRSEGLRAGRTYCVRFASAEEKAELERRCDKLGVTLAEALRAGVVMYLDDREFDDWDAVTGTHTHCAAATCYPPEPESTPAAPRRWDTRLRDFSPGVTPEIESSW